MRVSLALSLVLAVAGTLCAAQKGGKWKVIGRSGVPAMHAVLTTANKIVIVDKAEPSELTFDDGTYAWASEYDLTTNTARPLRLLTNTFCSAGAFLGNGTLLEMGGDIRFRDPTFPADVGFQSIRAFHPCDDNTCEFIENPGGIHMSSNRWYPAMLTLPDGRVMVAGGSTKGQGAVAAQYNNPTYEIFPRKEGEALNYEMPILRTTIPNNLYPQIYVLPTGNLFVLSNRDAVIYDYIRHRTVKQLPKVPGVPRTYPLTGSSVMLPLDPAKDYEPEILVCGGSEEMDRFKPADNTCVRIRPLAEDPEWRIEDMPNRRTMPDMVLLPQGNVLIVNGAAEGFAGYSNAKLPQLVPLLYEPDQEEGKRFSLLTPSDVPRIYHSVAMLLPDGRVWVAGSNPHSRISRETEFRVESYTPDYLLSNKPRATITECPTEITYDQEFDLTLDLGFNPQSADEVNDIRVFIAHLGFVTHSTHMGQRHVLMRYQVKNVDRTMTLTTRSPPNPNLFPPGKHWLYVVVNGVPAVAKHVWIH
ncbi:uncharacterized protein VTP21DRAFT_11114 [Calcarisporiella thermophila]|uniref:uncharacterized protein n=1 Tax=Calcarisporiella thermophila TaxID=911321 RepID=UPI0037434A87